MFQAAGIPGRTQVVVGLPPGARHELGALAFAVALRRRGVGVLYLGPDVPVDGWVDAVTRTRAKAAVIGTVVAADPEAAVPVLDAIRPLGLRLLAVGGAAATPDIARRLGAVGLPERVVDAAVAVADVLARRA